MRNLTKVCQGLHSPPDVTKEETRRVIMRVSCLTHLTLNVQEVNVVPLHSKRFVTELNAFMNSLAALAFHLTMLLNCSRIFLFAFCPSRS